MFIRLWLPVIFLFAPYAVIAHPAPFSYLDLRLEAAGVRGVLVIHDFDAAHELGFDKPERLLDSDLAKSYATTLTRILETRLRLTVDGRSQTPVWGTLDLLPDRQSLRFPFEIVSDAPVQLDLDAVLFPYDPNHQSFINVYEGDVLKHQAILSARNHTLTYYSSGIQGRWAVVYDFVRAGMHHIFIGVDHILFLLGLLLLGGSLWRLATIVTAFTVGHSITLSLAVLGIVYVAPHIVEPAIALSIVVVGVDNLLVRHQTRRGKTETRDLRPWLAGAFGLIHGFGFAAVLLEVGLPRGALGWSLAAFNIGVELGQIAIVLVAASGLSLLRRFSPAAVDRLVPIGSIVVIAAGAYWFVQRIAVM